MIQPRYILLILLTILHPSALFAKGPVLHIEPENIHLGVFSPKSEGFFFLQIGNQGDQTLTIESVHSGCGCLFPEQRLKGLRLQPSEVQQVKMRLHTDKLMRGSVQRTVLLTTNDPKRKYARINISFFVKPEYHPTVIPDKICLGRLQPKTSFSAQFTVVSPYTEPLKIESPQTTNAQIRIIPKTSFSRRDTMTFSIQIPEGYPPGLIDERILLKTNAGEVAIPVTGEKLDAIEYVPKHVVFPPCRRGQTSTITLRVRSTSGTPFRLTNIKSENDQIQPKLIGNSKPAKMHEVRLVYTPSQTIPTPRSCGVILHTDVAMPQTVSCSYLSLQ